MERSALYKEWDNIYLEILQLLICLEDTTPFGSPRYAPCAGELLQAFEYLSPENVTWIGDVFLQPDADFALRPHIIDALSHIGTPEAQAALVKHVRVSVHAHIPASFTCPMPPEFLTWYCSYVFALNSGFKSASMNVFGSSSVQTHVNWLSRKTACMFTHTHKRPSSTRCSAPSTRS